ncbi:hypothetical protein AMATHDRAFT_64924 [Amanita thiersii Skay4041]|uniref:F-box domain-containing protein n=1 Tax=Amanita thiersii Skay4041 TaxID=703135 RepID=A0A2A9NLP3_9AGAR|nr:hypothetical protein AMATHDRAFT_64924 [Amanita thiersii Skay4041]
MMSNEIDDHHLNLFIPTILNSYRIGVLIVMITYEQLQTFLSGVRNEMVEHLTLYYGSWDGTYIPEELHQVPHFPFPNLKSFYFYSDYHRLELEWPRYFDWNRLCHLCLVMPIRPSKVWEILRQAMALESLKVFGLKPDVDGHHGAEAVTLPDLTSLSIQVLNYGEPCQLLHLLRYPNLEYLRIKGPNVVWDGGIFSSLARQSNFNKLQRFVFEGTITMDNFHVDRLLNDLPNLRKLSVPDGTKISQSTLMKLTDGGLGKHLTILAVGGVRLYSRRFESTMNSLYKG